MSEFYNADVFDELQDELNEFMSRADDSVVYGALEAGAQEFVTHARRLASPRSKITKSGYTHLLDTVGYQVNKTRKDVEVGWGKYYGPIVEKGTIKMKSNAHLKPLWTSKKTTIQQTMLKVINIT